jgi:uroporphyrinogen decarboxylase
MAMAYRRLKEALGITSGDIYVYDMIMQLAVIEPAVMDALGLDVVELGRAFLLDNGDWKDWVLPDGTPCKIPAYINIEQRGEDWYLLADDGRDLAVQKHGMLYFDQTQWPLAEADFEHEEFSVDRLREAFAHSMWTAVATPGGHLPLTDDGLRELAAGARALRASTDRAIVAYAPGGSMFDINTQMLFGAENYFMYMALFPEACIRLSEALCALYLEDLEKVLSAVGSSIDIVMFADDLGGQNGPFMSSAMFRVYYLPYFRRIWARTRELTDAKILLHVDGGIEPLLDDLIDAGLEAINPVQITCRDMDARHLKDRFGERLTFWGGGCDTRDVLPRGTPEEVRRHVREQVSILNAGGGFVFTQVHNIQADVPIENILAMYQAVREP